MKCVVLSLVLLVGVQASDWSGYNGYGSSVGYGYGGTGYGGNSGYGHDGGHYLSGYGYNKGYGSVGSGYNKGYGGYGDVGYGYGSAAGYNNGYGYNKKAYRKRRDTSSVNISGYTAHPMIYRPPYGSKGFGGLGGSNGRYVPSVATSPYEQIYNQYSYGQGARPFGPVPLHAVQSSASYGPASYGPASYGPASYGTVSNAPITITLGCLIKLPINISPILLCGTPDPRILYDNPSFWDSNFKIALDDYRFFDTNPKIALKVLKLYGSASYGPVSNAPIRYDPSPYVPTDEPAFDDSITLECLIQLPSHISPRLLCTDPRILDDYSFWDSNLKTIDDFIFSDFITEIALKVLKL